MLKRQTESTMSYKKIQLSIQEYNARPNSFISPLHNIASNNFRVLLYNAFPVGYRFLPPKNSEHRSTSYGKFGMEWKKRSSSNNHYFDKCELVNELLKIVVWMIIEAHARS